MHFDDDTESALNILQQEMECLPLTQVFVNFLQHFPEEHAGELLDYATKIGADEHWKRFAEPRGIYNNIIQHSADVVLDRFHEAFRTAFAPFVNELLSEVLVIKLIRFKSAFRNAQQEGRLDDAAELHVQVERYQQLCDQYPPNNGMQYYLEQLDLA